MLHSCVRACGLALLLVSGTALAQMDGPPGVSGAQPGQHGMQGQGGEGPQGGNHPSKEQMDAARACLEKNGIPKPENGQKPHLTPEQKMVADGCFKQNGIDHPPGPPPRREGMKEDDKPLGPPPGEEGINPGPETNGPTRSLTPPPKVMP